MEVVKAIGFYVLIEVLADTWAVFRGGGGCTSSLPSPLSEFRGVYPSWIFLKALLQRVLTWSRSSMTTEYRQVGQAEKNGDAHNEACLNFGH